VSGERIVVVDDNALNLKLVRFLLVKRGYLVTTATDAIEAMALLSGPLPDLILLDLQLPGVDGYELARRIRRLPACQHIPIVAVTASAMRGDEERALAAGCAGYIAKPIDTRSFPSLVATYLAPRDGGDS
jgi:CheY-like chemotaxis protein